jgi:hypothetical protein
VVSHSSPWLVRYTPGKHTSSCVSNIHSAMVSIDWKHQELQVSYKINTHLNVWLYELMSTLPTVDHFKNDRSGKMCAYNAKFYVSDKKDMFKWEWNSTVPTEISMNDIFYTRRVTNDLDIPITIGHLNAVLLLSSVFTVNMMTCFTT